MGIRSEHAQPADGVPVFAISGKHCFRARGFLAYGLEHLGDWQGATLSMPPHPGWRWLVRRPTVVGGRDAEEILGKLISLLDVRLYRLGEQRFRPAPGDHDEVCELGEAVCCGAQRSAPEGTRTRTVGTGAPAAASTVAEQLSPDTTDTAAEKPELSTSPQGAVTP